MQPRHKAVVAGLALTLAFGVASTPAIATTDSHAEDTADNASGGTEQLPAPTDYDRTEEYEEGDAGAAASTFSLRSRSASSLEPMALSSEMKYFAENESGKNYDLGFSYGDGYNAMGYYQFDRRYSLVPFMQQCYDYDPVTYAMFAPVLERADELKNGTIYNRDTKSLTEIGQMAQDAWHAAYAANPSEFSALQDGYAYQNYYLPVERSLRNEWGVEMSGRADCTKGLVWGMCNLFGSGGVQKFFEAADLSNDMTDEQLVNALCDAVVNYYRTGEGTSNPYAAGYVNRYNREKATCQAYLAEHAAQAPVEEPVVEDVPVADEVAAAPAEDEAVADAPAADEPVADEPAADEALVEDAPADDSFIQVEQPVTTAPATAPSVSNSLAPAPPANSVPGSVLAPESTEAPADAGATDAGNTDADDAAADTETTPEAPAVGADEGAPAEGETVPVEDEAADPDPEFVPADPVPASEASVTQLKNAVSSAKALLDDTMVSSDGSDVPADKQWVTQEAYDNFNNQIGDANLVADGGRARMVQTQQDVDSATNDLSAARGAFMSARKAGTKAVEAPEEKTEAVQATATASPKSDDEQDAPALASAAEIQSLKEAVAQAYDLLNGTKVSADGSDITVGTSWAPADAHNAFRDQIDAASAVAKGESPMQADVKAASESLSEAKAIFEAARKDGLLAKPAGTSALPQTGDGASVAYLVASGISALGTAAIALGGSNFLRRDKDGKE